MSAIVFQSRNPPFAGVQYVASATLFNGAGVGYVIEWARKVFGGLPVESSKPRERVSRELTAVARARQLDRCKKGDSAEDLQDAWEGGLMQVGLQATTLPMDRLNGPQLLRHLCEAIPAGGLCAVSIALPPQQGTAVVYHATALMRQHPDVKPGPLLFFDPRFGLYQCDSAEDFAQTVQYLDAYTEPAWSYAIQPMTP